MPVNLQAADPEALHAVPGLRIGIAMAGVRKANRRDLVLFALDEGSAVAGVFTLQPLLRRAGAGLPRAPGRPAAASARWSSTPATPMPAPAPTAWRARAAPAPRWPALMGLQPQQVLPFSTGVIMETLPVERIEAGLPAALADLRRPTRTGPRPRQGIMTTDTLPKAASRQVTIGGQDGHASPASPRAPA